MLFGVLSTSQIGKTSTGLHTGQRPTAMPDTIVGLRLLEGPQQCHVRSQNDLSRQTAKATLVRLVEFETGCRRLGAACPCGRVGGIHVAEALGCRRTALLR